GSDTCAEDLRRLALYVQRNRWAWLNSHYFFVVPIAQ
ncbi:unnamed protein product, partial [marine sediment metagenome]